MFEYYYSKVFIRFNMMNSVNLAGREISVMKREEELAQQPRSRSCIIRCMRARNIDKLGILMDRMEVSSKSALFRTIYASSGLILWKNIGFAENNKYIDNDALRKKWQDRYDKALIGQDLIIDIDAREPENFSKGYETARKIKTFFDRMKFTYGINFSGSKGFHIRISWYDIKKAFPKLKPLEAEPLYKKFIHGLVDYLDLDNEYVDRSTLYRRQPIRIPYSIHSSGMVCLPLSDYQFGTFKPSIAHPISVLRLRLYDRKRYFDRKGFNRGMCYRTGDHEKMKKIMEGLAYA